MTKAPTKTHLCGWSNYQLTVHGQPAWIRHGSGPHELRTGTVACLNEAGILVDEGDDIPDSWLCHIHHSLLNAIRELFRTGIEVAEH